MTTTSDVGCDTPGETFYDATSTSTDSASETILSFDSISCNALCDLLLDTDTIPKFLYYKHQKNTNPNNQDQYPAHVIVPHIEHGGDRYEYVQLKYPAKRKMILDTDDESSSDHISSESLVD